MKQFDALRPKTFRFLIDYSDENKKAEGTKKSFAKRKPKFEDYKHCLIATDFETIINHLEKRQF